MRADVLHELQSRHTKEDIDAWVWLPLKNGEPGMWDERSRTFSSKFSRSAEKHGIKIPREVGTRHSITDRDSLERALHSGAIVLLGPVALDASPVGRLNRLHTPMLPSPPDIPTVNVAYRGAALKYAQPLSPSAYREFLDPTEGWKYDRLRSFACNLVMETVADEFGELLTANEAESIVQHYKILPWTLMIDLTLDVNVGKAFAALSSCDEASPRLYQVVLWNLGLFDTGAILAGRLKFAHPLAQAAVAHFGFALDAGKRAFDRYGLLISVTEHILDGDRRGWEQFGGPGFSLNGEQFEVPLRGERERVRLEGLLYPCETDERARVALARIVAAMNRQLHRFHDLGEARVMEVRKALAFIKEKMVPDGSVASPPTMIDLG
jgi:hypothetical protein